MDLEQLRSVANVDELAATFGCSYSSIAKLIYGPGALASYKTFIIPKRSGGFRKIDAPKAALKALQRQLLQALTEAYVPTRSAFGFVKDRCIVDNAERHVGRAAIVNVDLQDFFPSITFRRVRGVFLSPVFNLPYEVATVLAQMCCANSVLAQGAPTSPIISNFVCTKMDRELGALAGSVGAKYTRYCDDMTISFVTTGTSMKKIALQDSSGLHLSAIVEKIIGQNGFVINYTKLKLRNRRQRQEVTGLIVNEKVNVRRDIVRKIRSVIHCVNKFGIELAAKCHFEKCGFVPVGTPTKVLEARLRGWIAFVKMVRGNGDFVFADLARRYNAVAAFERKIKYYQQATSAAELERAVWIIEVGYDDPEWGSCFSQGTAFLLQEKGFVTCAHVVINDQSNRPYKEIEIFRVGSIMRHRAFVASFDPSSDLAILYVEGISWARDCDIRLKLSEGSPSVGTAVEMIGFPAYQHGQSLYRAQTAVAAKHGNMIELVAAVPSGISGGPLLGPDRRVVGILVKGVHGGAAKNEAIDARKVFDIGFDHQDLSRLPPLLAKAPGPRGWRKTLSNIWRFLSKN